GTGCLVAGEGNMAAPFPALDFELALAIAEPQSALAFAGNALTIRLPRYAALALAQNVVDCGGDSRQYFTRLTLGCLRVKSPAKFFGNETGGEFSGLPAGVRHQRRQEENVVAEAVHEESVERVALPCNLRPPGPGMPPPPLPLLVIDK